MKHDNMENERGVRGFDFMLRAEVDGDTVLPFFQLVVQLADGIQELSI